MGISTPAVTIPTYARPQGGYASYTPPVDPSNLSASVAGTTVNLTWVSNSTNETGFQVERAVAIAGPWSIIAAKSAGVTNHADTSLAPGTYYYRVSALRFAQSSGYAASGAAIVSSSSLADDTPYFLAGNYGANNTTVVGWLGGPGGAIESKASGAQLLPQSGWTNSASDAPLVTTSRFDSYSKSILHDPNAPTSPQGGAFGLTFDTGFNIGRVYVAFKTYLENVAPVLRSQR